ncbi:MAG TPA: apolipoprotein N-acyltransferase [Sporichthyaceae bacterium]|jgi:apolipoprotein N-acyltransferase|nr:apolipoprotein N-acyltransferase [Sporichthyaceae bacterium]
MPASPDLARARRSGLARVGPVLRPAGAVASGALLATAFPPFDLWPAAFVAVAALNLLTRGCSGRRGAVLGFAFGLGFFGVLLRWLHVVGWDAVLALSVLEALFLIPVGTVFAWTAGRRAWPVSQAVVWVAAEALRSRTPFGGLPWGRLAFSQAESPLLGFAALGGAPSVSLAVAAVGLALAETVRRIRAPRRLVAPAVVIGVVFAGAAAVPLAHPGADQVTVALVQGNVPRAGYDTAEQQRVVFANHVAATHDLATAVRAGTAPKPDLVIWPENSSDMDPFGHLPVEFAIDAAVDDIGAPTLVGAVLDAGPKHVRNVGIVWSPGKGPGEFYTKRHPVPFGEYLPLRPLVTALISRLDRVPRDFEAGHRPGVLDLGATRIGDVICFEIAYDDLVRDVVRDGGRLLVVQTNNATYGRTGQPEQQLAITRLRAVEHGRAVVVAATSGISAVIAPDGSLRHRTSEFTREVTVSTVPLLSDRTVADRVGAWPEAALSALAIAAALVARPRRRPNRAASTTVEHTSPAEADGPVRSGDGGGS